MLVRCIKADGKILKEGEIFYVTHITPKGNFLLDGVDCPKGYNCFDSERFEFVNDPVDQWNEELERQFWQEQPVL